MFIFFDVVLLQSLRDPFSAKNANYVFFNQFADFEKSLLLTDLFEKTFFQCNRIRILFKGMEGLRFCVGTSLGTCRQAIVILKCIT